MIYALKIAWRYLTASKAQTALLVAGVAVGVFIFIFMSALIGGLAEFIISNTVGDISHVTVEAEARDPDLLLAPSDTLLLVQQATDDRAAELRNTAPFMPLIAALPGVRAVSPQITGAGFLTRGTQVTQIGINGIEPGLESAIIDLDGYLVEGTARLGAGSVLMGRALVRDADLRLGQTVRLSSSAGIDAVLTLTGIYAVGADMLDLRTAYVGIGTARTLFRMPQGVTRIEIKLTDLYAADSTATRIAALTGLDAQPWTAKAAQLMEALAAQSQTGLILKTFAMITIVIGVASALLLSTYRRRAEIGIMRAMGASRWFVVVVFVTQGAMIGILGGLAGAGIGYLALLAVPARDASNPGVMPIDIRQGAYGLAILLTSIGSILAAILPARAAARMDPVTAIGQ